MKLRVSLIVFLLVVASSVCALAADDDLYYMAQGKRYSLRLESTKMAIFAPRSELVKEVANLLKEFHVIVSNIEDMKRYNLYILHFAKRLDEDTYKWVLELASAHSDDLLAQPFYMRGKKVFLIPNGKIFVRFVNGFTYDDLKQIQKQYGLVLEKKFSFGHLIYSFYLANKFESVLDVANALEKDSLTVWAQPEFIHPIQKKSTPNDPMFPDQWHLNNTGQNGAVAGNDVKAVSAWDETTGDGAIIAVVDDGVELTHPDLASNVLNDGIDLVDNDNDPNPGEWDAHGTCVAGVAAAKGNNGIGGTGACMDCKILPIRLLGMSMSSEDEAYALSYAVQQGAWVINNSWGAPDNNEEPIPMPELVKEAVDFAINFGRNGLGSLVTFAAGNGDEPVNTDGYPSYEYTLAIAASTDLGVRADYSDYGPEIEINAPSNGGINGIYTTDNLGDSGYDYGDYTSEFGGTSSATPLASGVYALIMAKRPDLSWYQIRQIVRDTADKIDTQNGNYDSNGHSDWYGYGRINADAAVRAAMSFHGCTPQPEQCNNVDDDCDNMVDEGDVCNPCEPSEEVCDGFDNDCDHLIDEDGVCDGVEKGLCMPCRIPDECETGNCSYIAGDEMHHYCFQSCRNGEECPEHYVCDGYDCVPENSDCDLTRCLQREEICNGEDDNCNGEVDEGGACCTPTDPPDEVCDGVDNDCDGNVDNVDESLAPADLNCGGVGVCEQSHPVCMDGEWVCWMPSTYEETETSCDGLDNDCDGETDEPDDLIVPEGACHTEGICKDHVEIVCQDDHWLCKYPEGYEETETTCDRLDNDCDGLIDEDLPIPDDVCPSDAKGVCKDARPLCSANGWICSYPTTYEEGEETKCDGLDNDCDGEIDEGLDCNQTDGDEESTEDVEAIELEQESSTNSGKEEGAKSSSSGCASVSGMELSMLLALFGLLRLRSIRK